MGFLMQSELSTMKISIGQKRLNKKSWAYIFPLMSDQDNNVFVFTYTTKKFSVVREITCAN